MALKKIGGDNVGHAIAFDTLAYAKRLIAVGMPPKQAEEQIEIFAEILDNNISTKLDLKELEGSLKIEIEIIHKDIELIRRDIQESNGALRREMQELNVALRRDMQESDGALHREMKENEASLKKDLELIRRDMKELEMRMTIRLGSIMTAGIAIVAALVKFL